MNNGNFLMKFGWYWLILTKTRYGIKFRQDITYVGYCDEVIFYEEVNEPRDDYF